ncbi:MAG: PDZ domain-containing protein, partial [Prevotellaceae bacterium]|jgi:C-terminal processing protease CtpA/Prc|nr:PDZ domain-containing protein [Prevotellaceae bacterium]
MKSAYFWTSTVDWDKVNLSNPDPFDMFGKLKYKDDRWSMLTNDYQGLMGQVTGVTTTYGYSLIFGKTGDTEEYIAIVRFVYPGSPAEKAGIKRGDFIVSIDGKPITASNRLDLRNSPSITIQKGILQDGSIVKDEASIKLTAKKMYEDPVNTYKVIEKKGKKTGYLCYTDYVTDSEEKLIEVFSEFKAQNVDEVVLDLRYNGGGTVQTARLLCSILAPEQNVRNKDVLLVQKWNSFYTNYWKQEGKDSNDYFTDTVAVNLNLSRLFVLTSSGSASASESTITGLSAYLNLVQIGDTTHGKYYGGYIMQAQNWDRRKKEWVDDPSIENWGVYVMVYRFEGKNGIANPNTGLLPDIYVTEDYFNLYPFGDERDPLLAEALSQITGEAVQQEIKKVKSPPLPLRIEFLETDERKAGMVDIQTLPVTGQP